VNPAFASTLLAQFKEVLSEIQEEMQNQNFCVLSCSLKAPLKHEQVFCFLLRSKEKEVDLLSEADYFTAEEADVLSEADFEEIEALFPLPEVVVPEVVVPKHCVAWLVPVVVAPEVVHKHCVAWLPPDAKLSDEAKLSDAEISDAEMSDAELYE
jgi:hypothetical protein